MDRRGHGDRGWIGGGMGTGDGDRRGHGDRGWIGGAWGQGMDRRGMGTGDG